MQVTSEMTPERLHMLCAVALGWIRYPTDSCEGGAYWHYDARAPFGMKIDVLSYKPTMPNYHRVGDWPEIAAHFKLTVCFFTNTITYRRYSDGKAIPLFFGEDSSLPRVVCEAALLSCDQEKLLAAMIEQAV